MKVPNLFLSLQVIWFRPPAVMIYPKQNSQHKQKARQGSYCDKCCRAFMIEFINNVVTDIAFAGVCNVKSSYWYLNKGIVGVVRV